MIRRDLHWWQAVYIEALLETDENLKVARIYEAVVALEQRLLSPVDPGSNEDINPRRLRLVWRHLNHQCAMASSRNQVELSMPSENRSEFFEFVKQAVLNRLSQNPMSLNEPTS